MLRQCLVTAGDTVGHPFDFSLRVGLVVRCEARLPRSSIERGFLNLDNKSWRSDAREGVANGRIISVDRVWHLAAYHCR